MIDVKLKVNTPYRPCWYRYSNDGYGKDVNGDFSSTQVLEGHRHCQQAKEVTMKSRPAKLKDRKIY